MSSSAAPLDIHMPLLAFAALMFEHGSPLSEAHWAAIDALADGAALDEELARAQHWLTTQGKGHAFAPLLQHFCAEREVLRLPEGRWGQLVALPVAGTAASQQRLAEALAQMDVSRLTQTGRLPSDARIFFLPAVYSGATVQAWRVAPRENVLDAALELSEWDDATVQRYLGPLARSLPRVDPQTTGREVRLLLAVVISTDPTWLDEGSVVAVGEDLNRLLAATRDALEQQGVPDDMDEDVFEEAFQATHGMRPEEAAELRAHALDHEQRAWDVLLAQANVADVDVHHLQSWSLALIERASLALRQRLLEDRFAHGLTDFPDDIGHAYAAPNPDQEDSLWILLEDDRGAQWGPYAVAGVHLFGDVVEWVVDSALSPGIEEGTVPVQLCASATEFPRRPHALH